MTRRAELETDAPKAEARGLQTAEGRAPHRAFRSLTSVELPEKLRQAMPEHGAIGPAGATRGALQTTHPPGHEGHSPGRQRTVPGATKADFALPFRLPTHCVWTVVDSYRVEGAQYLVLRGDSVPPGAPRALSRREAQAVTLAVRGHSNKVIAFEMGASAST